MTTVDFWADPLCPWTWLTAQWLLEVEQVRDVRTVFHVMSLSVLNDDDPSPAWPQGWGPVRVLTAADLSLGPEAVRPLYLALARLIHHENHQSFNRDLYAHALTRAGLPHTLANAAGSPFYDDEVRLRHRYAMALVGSQVGCPVTRIPRRGGEPAAFFGPVVNPCPRGEAAGTLWDSVALAAESEFFFELKRSRTGGPVFDDPMAPPIR